MSRRVARIIGFGTVGVTFLCVAGTAIGNFVSPEPIVSTTEIVVVGDVATPSMHEAHAQLARLAADGADFNDTGGPLDYAIGLVFDVFVLLWAITGALVVSRQPSNLAGWAFLTIALALGLTFVGQVLVTYGTRINPGSVPALGVWATFGEYGFVAVGLVPLLFLLYPNGRPPTHRWRWVGWVLGVGLVVAWVAYVLQAGPLNNFFDQGILYQNPVGIEGADFLGAIIAVGTIMVLVASLASVVAVVVRFRRSSGEERQKLRWLAFVGAAAGTLFVMTILAALIWSINGQETPPAFTALWVATFVVLFLGIPASYLIAIFRHGLWDLDIVIRKTVLYGALAALFLVVGTALVLLVGRSIVGVPSGTQWALLISGLVMGLLFVPLRRVSSRLADRIVYRRRATPYQVLTAFSGQVGETVATEDVLPRMAEVLASGVGAGVARVWLHLGGSLVARASWPAGLAPEPLALDEDAIPPIPGEDAFEVRDRGELLGALSVRMPASDPMNESKARLVRDLAAQAGLVLRNVRLIEELRASRQRLVAAQDEERRRIERNLHDGAQQQLVALSVKLGLLQQLADRDASGARTLAGQLQGEAGDALENLRDLARGIYPPLLADQGLAAALAAQAAKSPVPAAVGADGVGRYPRDVEAAVYFSALEALQNVSKYASASTVRVDLTQEDGELSFRVIDDGVGFDPATTGYGTGLQGMADRLEAIGGRLEVRSGRGEGTTVTGRVPAAPVT
jgi:signal transduction histidine kinase